MNEATTTSGLDDAKVAQLKAQHGAALSLFEYEGTQLVFRCPNRHEHGRWLDKATGDKRAEAGRELAQACCVYPDVGALNALIEKFPHVVTRRNGIVDLLLDLAGADGEPKTKKL